MTDIYVHTSKLDNLENLKDLEGFTPPYLYDIHYSQNQHPNEWGLIKLGNTRIHFLVGKIKDDKCPWCNQDQKFIMKESKRGFLDEYELHLECNHCGSTGPKTFLVINNQDEDVLQHIEALIREKYSVRLQWDYKLVNGKWEKCGYT